MLVPEKLAGVINKYWQYRPEKFSKIRELHEKLLIPANCDDICAPLLNREIYCNKSIAPWVKRADKRVLDSQNNLVKATAGIIKLSESILQAEKQNYVVNTKEILSLAMESVMLLGFTNHSLNNIRREKIKYTLPKDLRSLCENGNPPTKLLLGDDLPRKIKEAKEASRLLLPPAQPTRFSNSGPSYSNGSNYQQQNRNLNNNSFLRQAPKHKARNRNQGHRPPHRN